MHTDAFFFPRTISSLVWLPCPPPPALPQWLWRGVITLHAVRQGRGGGGSEARQRLCIPENWQRLKGGTAASWKKPTLCIDSLHSCRERRESLPCKTTYLLPLNIKSLSRWEKQHIPTRGSDTLQVLVVLKLCVRRSCKLIIVARVVIDPSGFWAPCLAVLALTPAAL